MSLSLGEGNVNCYTVGCRRSSSCWLTADNSFCCYADQQTCSCQKCNFASCPHLGQLQRFCWLVQQLLAYGCPQHQQQHAGQLTSGCCCAEYLSHRKNCRLKNIYAVQLEQFYVLFIARGDYYLSLNSNFCKLSYCFGSEFIRCVRIRLYITELIWIKLYILMWIRIQDFFPSH